MASCCNENWSDHITFTRYWGVLAVSILLGMASLAQRQAPWGLIYARNVGLTGTTYDYDVWLSHLSVQICMRPTDGSRFFGATEWCITFPYEDPNSSSATGSQTDGEQICHDAGWASLILFIAGFFFVFICVFLKLLLCESRSGVPIWVQPIFLTFAVLCLLVSLAVFHNACTLGVRYRDWGSETNVGAYGYAFACCTVIFMLVFVTMHVILLCVDDEKFSFGGKSRRNTRGQSDGEIGWTSKEADGPAQTGDEGPVGGGYESAAGSFNDGNNNNNNAFSGGGGGSPFDEPDNRASRASSGGLPPPRVSEVASANMPAQQTQQGGTEPQANPFEQFGGSAAGGWGDGGNDGAW